jgi:hypothetical protein
LLDDTIAHRALAVVTGVAGATVGGAKLSAAQAKTLLGASAGFSAGYGITALKATTLKNGNVLVSGRLANSAGTAPPVVALYTYQLTGTITNAAGQPVQGAVVITRTADRDFWTFSSPSDASGHFSSFFTASDESGANPVPLSVGVTLGGTAYGGTLGITVNFDALHSSNVAIQLGSGVSLTAKAPSAYAGAVYEGTVVGVSGPGGVIKPLSERWPNAKGDFSFVLPSSARGKTVQFWENDRQAFSPTPAAPGGPVNLTHWPSALDRTLPRGLATLKLP